MRKTAWFAFCLLICLSFAATSAFADSQTWNFTGTSSQTGAPCSTAAPCGQVTLTTSGDFATFTVTSLLTGYVFQLFDFNYAGPWYALSITSSSGVGVFNQCSPSCINNGWGDFNQVVQSTRTPSGCIVTGGVPGPGCTMTFTVRCNDKASCNMSDFTIMQSGALGSGYFSGTLYHNSDFRGEVGRIDEPATFSVLGSGLLAAAGILRRRLFGFVS